CRGRLQGLWSAQTEMAAPVSFSRWLAGYKLSGPGTTEPPLLRVRWQGTSRRLPRHHSNDVLGVDGATEFATERPAKGDDVLAHTEWGEQQVDSRIDGRGRRACGTAHDVVRRQGPPD